MNKVVYWDTHYFTSDFQKFFDTSLWTITNNLSEYLNSDCAYKLAVLGKYTHGPEFDLLIQQVLPISTKILIFDSELHDIQVEPMLLYKDSKIVWVIPGTVYELGNTIFNNQWLRGQIEMYRQPHIRTDLDQLTPYQPKQYYFDALLGAGKPHKDFVAEQIRADNLQDKIILRHGYKDFIFPQTITQGHGASLTRYKGWACLLSTIVPIDIYNSSAYSIIGETSHQDFYFFLTEKTAKCLISRRLFVMFSGQYWLREFRKLGFKTFGDVINESYDNIADPVLRWTAAYEQIKYLCSLDQQLVLDKIKPVLEHNYNHLWNTNWRNDLDQRVLAEIDFS